MEEEKFGISHEEEIREVIQKFERMKKDNKNFFFDVIEFETIIDFYIESNNSARAYEATVIASSQHPGSPSIQLRKARVLIERGRAFEAIRILKKLEGIEPGNHEIFIAKGTALGMLGDIQGAKKMFDLALTKDSEETENILYAITSVLQNLNYYEYLIPYLVRLIELEPGFTAHTYDLAYAYEKIQDYEKSIEYYRLYLEDEPFSDSAWYNLGVIYNKLDQSENALEAYEYALAINNQNTFALFNKGNILCNLDRFGEAIPVYHEYLEDEPDSFEAMTYLAECYDKTGNQLLARKYYNDAIELAPEFADPWLGLGVIAVSENDYTKALGYLRKAVKLDTENPEIWHLLGQVSNINNDKKVALRCFREALKLDPFYDEVWADLGKIILDDGFINRAFPFLIQAYRITGDVPGINYLLSSFSLHMGKTDEALVYLKNALEMDSTLFKEFREFFPDSLLNKSIRKLLLKKNIE